MQISDYNLHCDIKGGITAVILSVLSYAVELPGRRIPAHWETGKRIIETEMAGESATQLIGTDLVRAARCWKTG